MVSGQEFQRVFSGSPWEKTVGYCRAVRSGNQIFVSGTAPVAEDGSTYAPGDAYGQTRKCLEIIEHAAAKLGTNLRQVVRTRLFVTDISRWQDYGRAHGEIFGDHPPASAMIEVKALIDKDMLVEIEADLVI